ncbi:hypothetical protein, partial [Paraburkholderia sp. UCT2]|uniref:hypothetical protein n=1 Tax=Paraburkholderia sp. UCT2 TaxID=2615208 RepID=UPI001CA3A679
ATSMIHSDDHHPTTAGRNRPLLLVHLLNLAPPSSGAFTPPLTERKVGTRKQRELTRAQLNEAILGTAGMRVGSVLKSPLT